MEKSRCWKIISLKVLTPLLLLWFCVILLARIGVSYRRLYGLAQPQLDHTTRLKIGPTKISYGLAQPQQHHTTRLKIGPTRITGTQSSGKGIANQQINANAVRAADKVAGPSGWHVVDKDVLYLVKACRKFQARSQELYKAWGDKVSSVIFSTDDTLAGIPEKLQRKVALNDPLAANFMRTQFPKFHAASCATTLLNLGTILNETAFEHIKWLMILDDDTFVIRDTVPEYFSKFDPAKLYYLGLSNEEPLSWFPQVNGKFMTISATAPGVAYSQGVLDRLRADHSKVFSRAAVYDLCRKSQMGDDVAIGLLVWFQYKLRVIARPDLRGFHWEKERTPVGVKPLTIHTEQQFKPGFISRLKQLTDRYYPKKS